MRRSAGHRIGQAVALIVGGAAVFGILMAMREDVSSRGGRASIAGGAFAFLFSVILLATKRMRG
jgi:hypothetical protein